MKSYRLNDSFEILRTSLRDEESAKLGDDAAAAYVSRRIRSISLRCVTAYLLFDRRKLERERI